ncbi:hypothetical protein SORBI_3004G096200 [Sorghum bicolor]|uniref:Uncharacterized protein n=1 Tax=Sorghum bicolor TaxID=4558 RepID=A0A1Z5RLQ3_SORBI|nr:hypothetical protein SORBI_3004G096200 [Sorghum bicolor]
MAGAEPQRHVLAAADEETTRPQQEEYVTRGQPRGETILSLDLDKSLFCPIIDTSGDEV